MSQIPITREYATAVGEWCERVDNRSLLLNKFAFPKNWGDAVKENQASAWSLMRIASNGSILLQQKARLLANPGPRVQPDKAEAMKASAKVCDALAQTKTGSGLDTLRPKHTARLLELLRESYSANRLRIVEARLEGRLAINLAEGLIQNGGLNLDRIFGLPLINGSSVKGVARSAALEELRDKRDAATLETFVRVFGVSEIDWKGDLEDFTDIAQVDGQWRGNRRLGLPLDLKGCVTFLQATPTNETRIVVDITNVHTPDFYRTGDERDLANERPQPNYFPAVERGAEFAFPILLNGMLDDVSLLRAAEHWLSVALAQRGLGAKTAAGYGWFTDLSSEKRTAKEDAERLVAEQAEAERLVQERAAAEAAAFAALSSDDKIRQHKATLLALADEPFAAKVKSIVDLPGEEQRALIRLFSEDKAKKDRLKTWRKKKREIARMIETAASTLGEKLP